MKKLSLMFTIFAIVGFVLWGIGVTLIIVFTYNYINDVLTGLAFASLILGALLLMSAIIFYFTRLYKEYMLEKGKNKENTIDDDSNNK